MEVEYEGDASFLKDGLEDLLSKMAEISRRVPSTPEQTIDAPNGGNSSTKYHNHNLSTSTIAAHLGMKTGPELVICALAKLQIVDGKSEAKRSDILKEMKSATEYYKDTMRKNLTSSLKTLITNKRINRIGDDTYSLSAEERKDIEGKIANIR